VDSSGLQPSKRLSRVAVATLHAKTTPELTALLALFVCVEEGVSQTPHRSCLFPREGCSNRHHRWSFGDVT
jgi:hypothetical protein